MGLHNIFLGYVISEKEIKIKITERSNVVDYLVQDQDSNPDKKFEADIWKAIEKVVTKKYKVTPNSWQKKRID